MGKILPCFKPFHSGRLGKKALVDLDSSLAILDQELSSDSQMQRYIKLVVVVQVIQAALLC